MNRLHANAIRHAFRRTVLACSGVVIVACSGARTPLGGEGDGGAPVGEPCASEQEPGPRNCGWSYKLTGDMTTCGFDEAGVGDPESCKALCGSNETTCTGRSTAYGNMVYCGEGCAGRRYDGLDERGAPRAHDAASYLARMAFFEAASIDAFAILARELRRHRAPAALVRACFGARGDEVRHARMAATLAKRAAPGRPPKVLVPASPEEEERSLEALAIENASEGCIREAFGVLLGTWQALHAPTAELRAFFGKLAEDEARHAALAWRVDAFLRGRLDRAAHARVDRARDEALTRLARSIDAPAVRGVGLPAKRDAQRLFDAFVTEVTRFAIPDGGSEAAA